MPIPKLVVTAALMAAQVALGAMRKIEGPRLDSLDVTVADYGTPLPRFWGKRRFECPIIWAKKLKEKKSTSKTKGGKYKEYKYYGTWAVAIADCEIDAVTRIWFDRRLVFDVTKAGPVSLAALFGSAINDGGSEIKLTSRNMSIYLGTEDQMPDPTMETWCENRYGADSCPAYRGVAYIVFKNIPLETTGNRIPQISVEAVRTKTATYPSDSRSSEIGLIDPSFSPDGLRLYVRDAGADILEIWDTPTRELILRRSFPDSMTGMAIADDGSIFTLSGLNQLYQLSADGGGDASTFLPFATADAVVAIGSTAYLSTLTGDTNAQYGNASGVVAVDVGFPPGFYCEDADEEGTVWAVGVSGGNIYFAPLGLSDHTPFDFASPTASASRCYAVDNGDGAFFCVQGNSIFTVDKTGTVLLTGTANTLSTASRRAAFLNAPPGSQTLWVGIIQHDTRTLETLSTPSLSSWGASFTPTLGTLYDPLNDALIVRPSSAATTLGWLYLNRVSNAGTTLGAIVAEVADWCGVEGEDTSLLTDIVKGYSVTQGSGKDMVSPLLDAYDVDARPHDFSLQFLPRGTTPTLTLDVSEFVREGDERRYVISNAQDTDLPQRITLTYTDDNRDAQTNAAVWQRPRTSTDSRNEPSIDLGTLNLTADEALRMVERFGRRMWAERGKVTNALTAQQLALEPGDTRFLVLDDVTWIGRLARMTIQGQRINCEFKRDDSSMATLPNSTGAPMDGHDDEVIDIPGPVKGFVIDGPLLTDADSDVNPLLYFAAGGYGVGTFTGAEAYEGSDGSYDSLWGTFDSTAQATWGYVEEVMPDANPWLWDRGTELTVTLKNGTLTNATEAEIDEDPTLNFVAIGVSGRHEYVQFTTAVLNVDGTWTVSGFKRGRRGTEWACSQHEAGDEFILLTHALQYEMGVGDVGNDYSVKIAALARPIDSAVAEDFTFTGATLKPYAPAQINWTSDGTDMFGEIIRQTRVGGIEWAGTSDVPLSENSEAYEVDVMSGATVLRTIEVTGGNTFTYTGAQIAADGGSVGVAPDVNVYQLSDAVGRGFALAA